MAKWARIVNKCAVEITEIDPEGRFHPSIVWELVPDEVTPNSTIDDQGHWSIVDWSKGADTVLHELIDSNP